MTAHIADKVSVETEITPPEGDRLVDWIRCLQAALEAVPAEARETAKLVIHAYDMDGASVEFQRDQTDEERAAVAAKWATAKSLADASSFYEIDEWVRALRIKTQMSRDEAYATVRSGNAPMALHPKHPSAPKRNPPWQWPTPEQS